MPYSLREEVTFFEAGEVLQKQREVSLTVPIHVARDADAAFDLLGAELAGIVAEGLLADERERLVAFPQSIRINGRQIDLVFLPRREVLDHVRLPRSGPAVADAPEHEEIGPRAAIEPVGPEPPYRRSWPLCPRSVSLPPSRAKLVVCVDPVAVGASLTGTTVIVDVAFDPPSPASLLPVDAWTENPPLVLELVSGRK